MITRPCDFCQENYQAEPRYLNRGQGRFCSRKCSGLAHAETLDKPEPNVECAYCHERFYLKESRAVKSKSGLFFCSKSHQDEGYRLGLVTTGPERTAIYRGCARCGKSLGRSPRKTTTHCRECKSRLVIEQWLAGDNSVTLTSGVTKDTKPFVKRHLIETRGDACEQCGFDEKAPDGRSIIQMDHVDGNCLNNDPSNLRLLCPNHHAMTPNYGSLNKGSGRSHRRRASA